MFFPYDDEDEPIDEKPPSSGRVSPEAIEDDNFDRDPIWQTSRERYYGRKARWVREHGKMGRLLHGAHWLFHNNVVHPLLGVAAVADEVLSRTSLGANLTYSLLQVAVDVHHLSSCMLADPHQNDPDLSSPGRGVPYIPDLKKWLLHNNVAHPIIGLAPCTQSFAFHDQTAEEMGVKGWVLRSPKSASNQA